MKITILDKARKTAMLCGFVSKGAEEILGAEEIDVEIRQAIKDMKGEFGKIAVIPTPKKSHKRILVAGLGKKEKLTRDSVRIMAGKIAQKASEMKLDDYTIVVPPSTFADTSDMVSQIIEGCKMSLYKFDKFKSEKENHMPDLAIVSVKSKVTRAARIAEAVADGAIFAKDVANMPPNECTPQSLAKLAKTLAKSNNMRCKVISKVELKNRGFGGITAVGQGSKNEPKLIILEYKGGKSQKPTIFVGKAVTFDTGGISLKPGERMDEMKFDKCGGCTVLGIMKAASELKLPYNIVGIIPSVENMPGGQSYRPGDIIKLYNKKTAEILNTDAEGRLILADALSYGEKHYSPKAIIDLATLTGACIVSLGSNVAAMISNNRALAKRLYKASVNTAEEIWEMPLNDDYMDMIKSNVADIKNLGVGRVAGTITAAAFLRNAIEDTPWAHLDIAGVAWTQIGTKEKPYNPKGATGFGVRMMIDYLQNS